MSMYAADTFARGQSGVGAFPVVKDVDILIPDVICVDLTERDAIEEWRRRPYMRAHVISNGLDYRLGSNVTIAGQVWTEIEYADPNALLHDDILNPDGYIKPELIQNLFINDSYVVASQAAMLALSTQTGNAIIRTDTGQVFIKLNDDDPSDITDFADITGNTGAVTSVNGATGAVSVTIANLLAVPQNLTDFNTAVAANSLVASHSASLSSLATNKANLVAGKVPLSELPYTFSNGLTLATAVAKMGGSLTEHTTISQGSFNWTFDATGAGDFKLNLGSDATYDMYFRDSNGSIARLGVGTEGQILRVVSGAPTWSSGSASGDIIAQNGLTLAGDIVTLGGSLLGYTSIDVEDNYLALISSTGNYGSGNAVLFIDAEDSPDAFNRGLRIVSLGLSVPGTAIGLSILAASTIGVAIDIEGGHLRFPGTGSTAHIVDGNNNELLKFSRVTSAVNEFTIFNAVAGSGAKFTTTGGDTDIDAIFDPKGTGAMVIDTDTMYFGNGGKSTDGNWRMRKSGDNLIFEQRESGTYNLKFTING